MREGPRADRTSIGTLNLGGGRGLSRARLADGDEVEVEVEVERVGVLRTRFRSSADGLTLRHPRAS